METCGWGTSSRSSCHRPGYSCMDITLTSGSSLRRLAYESKHRICSTEYGLKDRYETNDFKEWATEAYSWVRAVKTVLFYSLPTVLVVLLSKRHVLPRAGKLAKSDMVIGSCTSQTRQGIPFDLHCHFWRCLLRNASSRKPISTCRGSICQSCQGCSKKPRQYILECAEKG